MTRRLTRRNRGSGATTPLLSQREEARVMSISKNRWQLDARVTRGHPTGRKSEIVT